MTQAGRSDNLLNGQPGWFAVWLGAVLAAAAVLRLFRLGAKSFWLDEATSVILTQVDNHTFVQALILRQGNMTFYYLLLRAWSVLGQTETTMRLLSVVFGVAAIPAIYLLGRDLFGQKAGRVAALLLSVHVFHIRYSQEARGYSLFVCLAIVSSLFCIRLSQRQSVTNCARYIVSGTLMVYSQVFGGWILLAHSIFLFSDRKIDRKKTLACIAAIAALIAPLAYCLFFISDRSQLAWVSPLSRQSLFRLALDLTADGGVALLLLYLILALTAIAIGFQQVPAEWPKYRFLLLWFFAPIGAVLLLEFWHPALEPRFLIGCVPPLILLTAQAVAKLRSRLLYVSTIFLLLILSASAIYSYGSARSDAEHADNWRDATRYILGHATRDAAVLFPYSEERLAFDVYRNQFSPDATVPEFPDENTLELLTRRPTRPSHELIGSIASRYQRVWVISAFQDNGASRKVDAELRTHFSEERRLNFGFVHVDLLTILDQNSRGNTQAETSMSK